MKHIFHLTRQDLWLVGLLCALAAYHISLLGVGSFSWPDENYYLDSVKSVPYLFNLELKPFIRTLCGDYPARPVEATLRLPCAIGQWCLEKWFDVGSTHPDSLLIPTGFNVVVQFLTGIIFYKLSLFFFGDNRPAAWTATLVYFFLASSNIYIRHVFAYYDSMFFMLLSLAFALGLNDPSNEKPLNQRSFFLTGLLAGLGVATYPAYFAFPPAVLGVIALQHGYGFGVWLSRPCLRAIALFALGGVLVLALCDAISRIGGISYLACAYYISKTITQGSFEEGYTFLFKYLFEVNQLAGFALVMLLGVYIAGPFWASFSKQAPAGLRALSHVFLLMTLAFFVRASQSTIQHHLTMTGRYIAWFMPVLVWAGLASLVWLPKPVIQKLGLVAVAICSILSLISFDLEYRTLAYPPHVLLSQGIRFTDVAAGNKVDETVMIPNWVTQLSWRGLFRTIETVTIPNDHRFVLVNVGYLALEGEPLSEYQPPTDAIKVYEGLHFLTFRASRFEAYDIDKREEFATRRYRVAIYRLPDESANR